MASSLRALNWAAAALHAAAAVGAALLLKPQDAAARQVQLHRTTFDEQAPANDSRVDIPVKLVAGERVDLRKLVVGFFAVTAAAHALYATDFFGRGWYSRAVFGRGWNPFRWIEYSISASLMVYLISVVSGTKESVSALTAALITPGLMLQGFTAEREVQQNAVHAFSVGARPRPQIDAGIVWSQLGPAWGLFALKWYIILANFSRLVKDAKAAGKPVEASVQFMVYSQLAFFSLFGAIQSYQVVRWTTLRRGRVEPPFATYEAAYIALSAVTKLALAGAVVYALRA
jgi:hypothetical protein